MPPPAAPPPWESWRGDVEETPLAAAREPLQLIISWCDARRLQAPVADFVMQGHCIQAALFDYPRDTPSEMESCGTGFLRVFTGSHHVSNLDSRVELSVSAGGFRAMLLVSTCAMTMPVARDAPRDPIHHLDVGVVAVVNETPGAEMDLLAPASSAEVASSEFVNGCPTTLPHQLADAVARLAHAPRIIVGQMRGIEGIFATMLAQRLKVPVSCVGQSPFGAMWLVGPIHSLTGPAACNVAEVVHPERLDAFPGVRLRTMDWHGRASIMAYVGRKHPGQGNTRLWNQSQKNKSPKEPGDPTR